MMINKRLVVSLLGVLGVMFMPKLIDLPQILRERGVVEISAPNLLYTFLGVVVLALLTGAIRKNEQNKFIVFSMIMIGVPSLFLFVMKQSVQIYFPIWIFITCFSIISVVIWLRQMVRQDKEDPRDS